MIAVGALGGFSALVYAGNSHLHDKLHEDPDYLMAKALGAFGDDDKKRKAHDAARQEERHQANLKKIKELRSEIGRRALEWNLRRVEENRMRKHENKIRSYEIHLREQVRMWAGGDGLADRGLP